MSLRLALALGLGLAPWAPARAAELAETHLSGYVVPLPGNSVVGVLRGEPPDRLGWSYQFTGGYVWGRNPYVEWLSPRVRPVGMPQNVEAWTTAAQAIHQFPGGLGLGLRTGAQVGGLVDPAPYDPALAHGLSAWLGPWVRYSTLDDFKRPRRGVLVEAWGAPGIFLGARQLPYWLCKLGAQAYRPLTPTVTLAFRASFQGGGPELSWLDKLSAGGPQALRGVPAERYVGDRFVLVSLELRDARWPALWRPWPGLALGLGTHAFVDAGRAWEHFESFAPFEWLQPGVGGGLFVLVNGEVGGRLELAGRQGRLVPLAAAGVAF